jgi:ATP-dependent DNA ligase
LADTADFDDGHALFEAVCAHELEGVVAKRKTSRYRPRPGVVKIKNREYWRYELELGDQQSPRARLRFKGALMLAVSRSG